jgi:hypothetical protein
LDNIALIAYNENQAEYCEARHGLLENELLKLFFTSFGKGGRGISEAIFSESKRFVTAK